MSEEELEKIIKNNINISAEEIQEITRKMQEEQMDVTEEDVINAFILAQIENYNKKPTLEAVINAHETMQELENLCSLDNFDFSPLDNLETVAKKQGFSSKKEMFLYEDVCAGRLPKGKKTIEIDSSLSNPNFSIEHIFSKEELEKVISEENLRDLLEEVKDLSFVDRLHKIFLWNSNRWAMLEAIGRAYTMKAQEAYEIIDYETAEIYYQKAKEIEEEQKSFYQAIYYLNKRSMDLTREERERYRKNVEEVQNNIFPSKAI